MGSLMQLAGLRLIANLLGQKSKFEEAIQILLSALRISPTNTNLLTQLGYLYVASGDPGAAVDVLTRALDIDPFSTTAHRRLGNALRLLGAKEDAKTHFQIAESLSNKPAFYRVLFGEGRNGQGQQLPEEATH